MRIVQKHVRCLECFLERFGFFLRDWITGFTLPFSLSSSHEHEFDDRRFSSHFISVLPDLVNQIRQPPIPDFLLCERKKHYLNHYSLDFPILTAENHPKWSRSRSAGCSNWASRHSALHNCQKWSQWVIHASDWHHGRHKIIKNQLINKHLSDYFRVDHVWYCRAQLIQDIAFAQKNSKPYEKNKWLTWQNICCVSKRWTDSIYLN